MKQELIKERLEQIITEKRLCHANIEACNDKLKRTPADKPAYMQLFYEKNGHKDSLGKLIEEEKELLEKIESFT